MPPRISQKVVRATRTAKAPAALASAGRGVGRTHQSRGKRVARRLNPPVRCNSQRGQIHVTSSTGTIFPPPEIVFLNCFLVLTNWKEGVKIDVQVRWRYL